MNYELSAPRPMSEHPAVDGVYLVTVKRLAPRDLTIQLADGLALRAWRDGRWHLGVAVVGTPTEEEWRELASDAWAKSTPPRFKRRQPTAGIHCMMPWAFQLTECPSSIASTWQGLTEDHRA